MVIYKEGGKPLPLQYAYLTEFISNILIAIHENLLNFVKINNRICL